MYISKIRVKDYKSFRDSGEIEFKPGINLIVGQNNSGKTTLLEALEIKIPDIPHRSLKTPKNKVYSNDNADNSTLYVSLNLVGNDLPGSFEIADKSLFRVPLSQGKIASLTIIHKHPNSLSAEKREELTASLKKRQQEFLSDFISRFNENLQSRITINFKYSNLNPYNFNLGLANEDTETKMGSLLLVWQKEKSNFRFHDQLHSSQDGKVEDFGSERVKEFRKKIYRFNAERPKLGMSLVTYDKELKPDASNLAGVLQHTVNENHHIYEEFNMYVSEVIPSVKWVSSVGIPHPDNAIGTYNEVRIWSVNKNTRRKDLAFPLSSCGTGIGQVLAILYVVVASEEPRTIIIDEPNSFLHPGAAKKLIQILNKFPQHQYFISTHSPEILSAAKPSTITKLKYVDGETVAESINLEQTKDLRETLLEIGIRFSDVFFAENILWVEGPTEAEAFPMILEKEKELFGITCLPLVNPGDLREKKQARKNAKLAFEIYKRLSGAHALTPPFVAVVFDKEEENEQEVKELETLSKGKAKFIPRRMFENYLLDAKAIAEVYNSEPNLAKNKKVTVKQVDEWISDKRESKEYLSDALKEKKAIKDKEWLENVDGARLLENLFIELKGHIEYRKTTHSIKLTQWLLENKPEMLDELKNFLINLISDEKSA